MAYLGNKLRLFCHFWGCTQVLHFELFCQLTGYSNSSMGFLPTVVDIMVTWIKFPFPSILVHWFLRGRCSSLPFPAWPHPVYLVQALTFPVPTQHCCLRWLSLSPLGLSTVSVISALSQPLGSFWAISSCPPPFPRSIWDTFRPGGLIFWFHILLSFCTIPDFPMASILEWFASPSSSGSRFVRTVYYEIGMCSCKPINTNYYRQPPNTEREA